MTVQELIDELMKVEDKSKEVVYTDMDYFDETMQFHIVSVDEDDYVVELMN